MNETNEESIVNRIIPIETIFKVAEYIEDVKDEFSRLDDIDRQKNINLRYNEQSYEYKGANDSVQYTIGYIDGRKLTQSNYNWFKSNFNNPKSIKSVFISFITSYSSKFEGQTEYKQINIHISMFETAVYMSCRGRNNDEMTNKIYYDLTDIISNNEERYNNTVKYRKLRIQSFCLSIGIILSYILYFVLLISKSKVLLDFIEVFNNKRYLVFVQWIIALGIGNLFGLPYMRSLYNTIIPKTRYSHYSKLDKKGVYKDDIENYISQDEVQIGKFTDNGMKRLKIEKIYKVTKIIVLMQLAISIVLFLIIK